MLPAAAAPKTTGILGRALQSIERALARVFDRRGLLLALCLGTGGAVSWWLGQDINWDLKNYHL